MMTSKNVAAWEQGLTEVAELLLDTTVDNPFFQATEPLVDLFQGQRRKLRSATDELVAADERYRRDDVVVVEAMYSFFAIQAACEGLAAAILITASKLLSKFASVAKEELNLEKEAAVLKHGPKAGATSWADAVSAASHYVRHGDEWHRFEHLDKPSGPYSGAFNALVMAGLSHKRLALNEVTHRELVELLDMANIDTALSKLHSWVEAVKTLQPR